MQLLSPGDAPVIWKRFQFKFNWILENAELLDQL